MSAVLVFLSLSGYASEPTLDYIFPVALPQGSKIEVTLGGKFDPWPVKVWTDCSGLDFTAQTNTEKPSTNSGKFSIQVSNDAPPGPHLLRVFNQDGASIPHLFLITRQKDEEEKEPNDSLKQAQPVKKLPATITGRLEKGGDVDSFSMHLDANQWLVARIDAYSLGSPVDALLHLFDEQGVRVAFNHDSAKNIDPLLAYRVEKAGTYFLQVTGFAHPPEANVKFAGTPAAIYRLSIADGPFAHHVYPTGVQRGHKAQLQLFGWNLDQGGKTNIEFDASTIPPGITKQWLSVSGVEGQFPVIISDVPEQVELGANGHTNQAQGIVLPCAVTGRIDPPGEEDLFRFELKKGARFRFDAIAGALDSPLDPVLKIKDSSGKVLAEDDDGGGRPDSKLIWECPGDGSYFAVVSDRFGNGGKDFIYRLAIAPPVPSFKVLVPENVIRLDPGKTNEIKLTVTRFDNYTNALRVKVAELPANVTLHADEVPPQNGEVKLMFFAATNALPTNQPFRIQVETTNSIPTDIQAAMFDLRGKEPRFEALVNETDQLWLTIIPKHEPAAKTEEKKKK